MTKNPMETTGSTSIFAISFSNLTQLYASSSFASGVLGSVPGTTTVFLNLK